MVTPKKIGKYEIQGALGIGGMGVVYKGWDPSIERGVAIKSINKSAHQDDELEGALSRFRQEAQAVGRLAHPRIVQIYDYIEDEQGAHIVMELVNGKTLKHLLDLKTQYSMAEIGLIIRQILDGIGYAHEYGVVHRDIKPSNIMIGNDGRVKINDFGIAHVESSNLTQVGDVLGTPHYMSPEQCLGAEIDGRTDIFSVGVIAYELLTGSKPFTGNFASVMNQVINAKPADPSQLNPQLAPLNEVLQKALAKKREERYQTATEFAEAFKQAMEVVLDVPVSNADFAKTPSAMLIKASQHLSKAPSQPASDKVFTRDDTEGNSQFDGSVSKAQILVVDDEERILTALKSLFRQRYHVFCATDGRQALEFMREHHMHAIISDQRMPAMLGVELLRRSREISPRSVRILLTGYSDLAAIVGSVNDGEIYRFISKPWDNQALQNIVAEAVTIGLELADTSPATVELPENMLAGVLVVENEDDIFRVTRELIGGLCPVISAADADAALQIMKTREIAVVVADVGQGKEHLIAMLKLLKQDHPQILAIVTVKVADSELVVDLINQAQIFRILNKPINVGMLKNHLHAALQRYLTFKQHPELLRAHKLTSSGQEHELERTSERGIMDKIKSLRGKLFGQ